MTDPYDTRPEQLSLPLANASNTQADENQHHQVLLLLAQLLLSAARAPNPSAVAGGPSDEPH